MSIHSIRTSCFLVVGLTLTLSLGWNLNLAHARNNKNAKAKKTELDTAKDSFEKLSPLLFQVKTSASPDLEKSSYGTGWVARKDGLLVTNFHVVAESVLKPKKNNIYVMVETTPLKAKVVGLDIVNDLALIQIEKEFEKVLNIATEAPTRGDEVYSLGLPEDLDWTVVKGTYNGIIKHGPYELIHMSSPINPGMSGGPTVNKKSELVGVNVSGKRSSQEISFSIPAEAVRELLQHYEKRKGEFNLVEEMERQGHELQDKLRDLIFAGLKKHKKVLDWRLPIYPNSIRCWGQNQSEDDDERYDVSEEACSIEHSIYLDGQRTFGLFQSDVKVLTNKNLNGSQWLKAQGSEWNETQSWVREFNKSSLINFDKPKCVRERIQSGKSLRIVRWCRQKILPFKDLEDNFLSILVQHKGRALVLDYTLSGFTEANVKDIVKAYLSFDYEGVAE